MVAPASVSADGSVKVVWVPAIADPENPTVAEVTGASAIDLTEYLTADGYQLSTDEQSVTDDRLSSRQTYERPGRFLEQVNLMYVYRQQDLAADDNKAYATLTHKNEGYVVSRWGADFEDAITAGDVVDVTKVQCGKQQKQTPEANSVLKVAQKLFVTSDTIYDAAVS